MYKFSLSPNNSKFSINQTLLDEEGLDHHNLKPVEGGVGLPSKIHSLNSNIISSQIDDNVELIN
jgi:hypothetical protein